jgi:hypothetical protein
MDSDKEIKQEIKPKRKYTKKIDKVVKSEVGTKKPIYKVMELLKEVSDDPEIEDLAGKIGLLQFKKSYNTPNACIFTDSSNLDVFTYIKELQVALEKLEYRPMVVAKTPNKVITNTGLNSFYTTDIDYQPFTKHFGHNSGTCIWIKTLPSISVKNLVQKIITMTEEEGNGFYEIKNIQR